MEEIVSAKIQQIPKVQAKLENSNSSTLFTEGTFDMQWGTGLDVDATLHTDHKMWPGENKLGKIYQRIASKLTRKLRSSSLPRRGANNEGQSNIEDFLKDLKKGRKKNDKSDAG